MGNLLRAIHNRSDDSGDIFVDFENCQPSPNEQVIWSEINEKLSQAEEILTALRNYQGAALAIRDAIAHHSDQEAQLRAWNTLVPLIHQLRCCYEFGLELAETVPKVLSALCSQEMSVNEHLEKQQALFKQFAEILDFVLKFDDLKMMKPSIQNDFSFYRRSCSRRRNDPSAHQSSTDVLPEDYASKMSLFYAEATPMLKIVSKHTSLWRGGSQIPVEVTTECLMTMTQICRGLVNNPGLRKRISNEDTLMLCLRVMTALIILLDHLDPEGVFKLKLDVKGCIRLLKEQPPAKVEGLLNALRYSTLHLNDDATPKAVKQLLTT